MLPILTLIPYIKDYIEIVHKLIETNSLNGLNSYYDFGAGSTFLILTTKEIFTNFLSFKWLQTIWSIPTLIPDIASAMVSEISIINGSFQNSMTLLEQPISYGNQNLFFYCLEKFMIGAMNSFFLFLPTSASHIITFRRFVMQGIEAGYIAGLGTIAGNFLWITSIIFGLRFLVIPWLSFDILRYFLGFLLLVKYMWDSYSERRNFLDNLSKSKIFFLNFLLSFTEQTNFFPYFSNLSIGSDSTLLESFPTLNENLFDFYLIHGFYIMGIIMGSLSLLQLTCWFWENPAYNIYIWILSSFKMPATFYYKLLNFFFLYLTMICAISNLSYFGLDYTITNPLGFTHEDRLIEQKTLLETSFLNSKASDRNTRRNRGRHGRRERWKRRVRRYRTFDASLYDQGVYDFFPMEDLNYGFDRFWLRRKIRNHRVRFRFFPGPWMRSFKKQLTRPRLESFMGPRVEFFRILFEQAYHPEFHEFKKKTFHDEKSTIEKEKKELKNLNLNQNQRNISLYFDQRLKEKKENLRSQHSAFRKFLRKTENRIKFSKIQQQFENENADLIKKSFLLSNSESILKKPISSKKWKSLFSKISHNYKKSNLKSEETFLEKFSKISLLDLKNSKNEAQKHLSLPNRFVLRYKTFLKNPSSLSNFLAPEKSDKMPSIQSLKKNEKKEQNLFKTLTLLHPLKFYSQQEKAFQKKLKFYGTRQFRNFKVEKNAPYYRVMMKRFFYYYKPTLRWERTMRVATMRKARRKGSRIPRKLNIKKETKAFALMSENLTPIALNSKIQENSKESEKNIKIDFDENLSLNPGTAKAKIEKPTHFYSLVSKRASRFRYEIYKDVLQHWYYSPFNRLLLKFDVDSFVRRQPKNHFLTKKDENFLHFKRFLMAEYYNSLRWYTYMQHYDSMKTKISGTKTLTSRIYNQQFMGTFKKIRHFFAITPKTDFQTILKFDQPLYNEYANNKKNSLLSDSVFHEEILADEDFQWAFPNSKLNSIKKNESDKVFADLKNQSADIIRNYLTKSNPIRQKYIEFLLENKNYTELTKFLFRGKKLRGVGPITNEKDFLLQENRALLKEKEILKDSDLNNIKPKLWFELLKKSQKKIYDQKALKNYVLNRVDKHEKQKQKKQKNFFNRLEKIKTWYFSKTQISNFKANQKLFSMNSQKKVESNFSFFPSSYSFAIKEAYNSSIKNRKRKQQKLKKFSQNEKILLKNFLSFRLKTSFNKIEILEQNFKKTYNTMQNSFKNQKGNQKIIQKALPSLIDYTLIPFKFLKKSLSLEKTKKLKEFLKIEKNLNKWRKREIVLSKRKKIRKTLKRLRNNKNLTNSKDKNQYENFKDFKQSLDANSPNNEFSKISNPRKKEDFKENEIKHFYKSKLQKSWKNYTKNVSSEFNKQKKFKKRRSRMRRYRFLKGRGPIKKRTLGEKLKGQFRFLKKYAATNSIDGKAEEKIQNKKQFLFKNFLKKKNQNQNSKIFELRERKQRRTRIRKHRFWKKHKKQKDAINRRKIKKRRRYGKAKIRALTKKFKNIEASNKIRKWWGQEFFPSFQENTEKISQQLFYEHLKNKFENLDSKSLFVLDESNPNFLQIGEKDFKPFAIPEAIRLLEDSFKNQLKMEPQKNSIEKQKEMNIQSNVLKDKMNENSYHFQNFSKSFENFDKNSNNVLNKISNSIPYGSKIESLQKRESFAIEKKNSPFMESTNPIPFYAGWDESCRKFGITNRFLSRKDATYQFKNSSDDFTEYLKAPFSGMNAPTTLYWQIPFTTYDPDQFFALGMDGFSPIGWSHFHFLSSKQTTKPILVKKIETILLKDSKKFSKDLSIKFLSKTLKSYNLGNQRISEKLQNERNLSNRIQKRYKRVKKHPRPPVWFPSGTLANQVLPVHYIYVFYKRYRLPRDRYIRRKLRRNKKEGFKSPSINRNLWTDYTLRKRSKPKRKYHRKNLKIKRKNEDFLAHLKRRKFRGFRNQEDRFRPISETQKLKELKRKKTHPKKKDYASKKQKISKDNIRFRQLRRRVQRQVFRPVWRYKPQSGGFVWPGDYLRFELVKAPKLSLKTYNPSKVSIGPEKSKNIRKKKRRLIQEWQVQPKKYFLQKHNLKVLKKRFQKSQNLAF